MTKILMNDFLNHNKTKIKNKKVVFSILFFSY